MRISSTKFARHIYIFVTCLIVPISLQAQIVVNSASDAVNPSDGICTLREAISSANNDLASGGTVGECVAGTAADTILFDIGAAGSVQTIQPSFQLPTITEAVLIDGPSQGCPSGPCIELDGSSAISGHNAIRITSSSSTIRGLAINRFGQAAISISGAGATDNTIEGNYIGTNLAGDTAAPNYKGVSIDGGTSNLIGGTTAAARNVISGNSFSGLDISGAGATSNTVQGNFIGIDVTGTVALANPTGIDIRFDASNNEIGGTAAGAGNVISGNSSAGINLNGASGNSVKGNLIGTNNSGTSAVANKWGIFLSSGAKNNVIGGTIAGTRNVISGNTDHGVNLQGAGVDSNRVEGNYTSSASFRALPLAYSRYTKTP